MIEVADNVRKCVVYKSFKNVFLVHSGDWKWVTTIECVAANETLINSIIIFERKLIQKIWHQHFSDTYFRVSVNEWTDTDHDLWWLKNYFNIQTEEESLRTLYYHILLIDDHNSHVSSEFIEYYWFRKIVSLYLLSHTTHYLQSLNVSCFEPLSYAYKK